MAIDILKINVRNDDDDAPALDMLLLLFLCARKEKAFLVVLLSRCSFFSSYRRRIFLSLSILHVKKIVCLKDSNLTSTNANMATRREGSGQTNNKASV